MNGKICPIFSVRSAQGVKCIESKCAFWCSGGGCAFGAIAEKLKPLDYIFNELLEIKKQN